LRLRCEHRHACELCGRQTNDALNRLRGRESSIGLQGQHSSTADGSLKRVLDGLISCYLHSIAGAGLNRHIEGHAHLNVCKGVEIDGGVVLGSSPQGKQADGQCHSLHLALRVKTICCQPPAAPRLANKRSKQEKLSRSGAELTFLPCLGPSCKIDNVVYYTCYCRMSS